MIDGIAHLYGTVNSSFEKGQAEIAASHVRGIVDIENHLRVLGSTAPFAYDPYVDDAWSPSDYPGYADVPPLPQKRDAVIEQDIHHELWWSPFVNADAVRVSVASGVATLTGMVDS